MELNKSEIAEKLKTKGAILPCHRCGNELFSVMDGYSKFMIQTDIDSISTTILGGISIPVVLIACNNCGAITTHAMGALDLLKKEVEKNDKS